jgi:hypothetical protein
MIKALRICVHLFFSENMFAGALTFRCILKVLENALQLYGWKVRRAGGRKGTEQCSISKQFTFREIRNSHHGNEYEVYEFLGSTAFIFRAEDTGSRFLKNVVLPM